MGKQSGIWIVVCLLALGMLAGCSSVSADRNGAVSGTPSAEGEVEEEIEVSVSLDSAEVEGIMNTFISAYFAGDADTIRQYLSEDYGQEVEVYSDPEHADEVQISGIRGVSSELEGNIGDECDLSLEFVNPGEDSLTYLTVGFVKEERGWRISFYGLEK